MHEVFSRVHACILTLLELSLLANAWEEEEDEVVLITCRVRNPDLEMFNGPLKETLEDQTTEL